MLHESAYAAEIGTMKVSEETDALEVMSIDPVGYLAVQAQRQALGEGFGLAVQLSELLFDPARGLVGLLKGENFGKQLVKLA